MINRVFLIGNLGADPEIRETKSGTSIANLRVATTENWKDKEGERQERTEWHRVAIFSDGLAQVAQKYLRKGSKVYIEGQLRTRQYEKDGETKYATEIVVSGFGGTLKMLDSKSDAKPKGYARPRADIDEDDFPEGF